MRASISFDRNVPPAQRLMSQGAAEEIGAKLKEFLGEHAFGIRVEHAVRAVTKISNNRVLNTDDGDRVHIQFMSRIGSGSRSFMRTNQINDAALKAVVAQIKSMAPPPPPANEIEPPDHDSPINYIFNPRELVPVSLRHDSTIAAMETGRAEAIPKLIEPLQRAQLSGAATIGLAARSVLYYYQQGLRSFAEETDCEVTVTGRSTDGTASGWAGQGHRDWSQVQPDTVVAKAIELAQRARNPVALEPGRRMAILGPAAVAQMVVQMARLFDWEQTAKARGFGGTPFTYPNFSDEGRHTKLGLRVFDPRIVMVSDPADPMGGFPPMIEPGGVELFMGGFPTSSITWIDGGVLKNLAFNLRNAFERDVMPCDWPRSVRLTTVPGTRTATIDEMISNCPEGIYVNRFSDVSLIDNKTGMMTGVTRDGCFLIKNGKIDKALKNFRFLDSPFFAFNNVEMIGNAERVAFGYNAPPGDTQPNSMWHERWPRLPIIVPPMMIKDFNFSALADAV